MQSVHTECKVCGLPTSGQAKCGPCQEVADFVQALPNKEDYILVVDGSHTPGSRESGAGLVLAREEDEVVIAACACSFKAQNTNEAEFQAIVRGLRWAPVGPAWSDNGVAIRMASLGQHPAEFIRQDMRDPLHNLAHRLANIGRQRDWDKLDRVWLPGEVWP